jgi:hypothetical protein
MEGGKRIVRDVVEMAYHWDFGRGKGDRWGEGGK